MNVWADRLIVDANLATVERWSDALPLEEIAKHPELAVKIAWALVFLRRHHKLRPLLTILEGASEQGIDSSVVRSMLAMVIDDVPTAFAIVETISLQAEKPDAFRSTDERRVGKECVRPSRSRGWPDQYTKPYTHKHS